METIGFTDEEVLTLSYQLNKYCVCQTISARTIQTVIRILCPQQKNNYVSSGTNMVVKYNSADNYPQFLSLINTFHRQLRKLLKKLNLQCRIGKCAAAYLFGIHYDFNIKMIDMNKIIPKMSIHEQLVHDVINVKSYDRRQTIYYSDFVFVCHFRYPQLVIKESDFQPINNEIKDELKMLILKYNNNFCPIGQDVVKCYQYIKSQLQFERQIIQDKIGFDDIPKDLMTHNIIIIFIKKILGIPYD